MRRSCSRMDKRDFTDPSGKSATGFLNFGHIVNASYRENFGY